MKIIPTDNPKSCRCDNCLARAATYDVYIGPLYKGTICDDCVDELRSAAERAFYVIHPELRLDISPARIRQRHIGGANVNSEDCL